MRKCYFTLLNNDLQWFRSLSVLRRFAHTCDDISMDVRRYYSPIDLAMVPPLDVELPTYFLDFSQRPRSQQL
eukprot:6200384-Pleurochrysis_carterae.AAC.9